jgi:SAM-dependent methyltransferase
MHPSALENAKRFRDAYFSSERELTIVEIGAQDVNGSLRTVFPDAARYLGLDFVRGKGVDIVLDDPYQIPLAIDSADIVLCSSVFEHSEFFWLTFLAILRILKPAGLFYLNALSNGDFHRYPVDCWRFYPDSGAALVKWGRRNGFRPLLLESYISVQDRDVWNDYVAVFLKDEAERELFQRRVLDNFAEVSNATRLGVEGFQGFSAKTEDQLQNARLGNELAALELRLPPAESGRADGTVLPAGGVWRWSIDSPRSDAELALGDDGTFRLRGWALGKSGSRLHVAMRQNGLTRCYPLNQNRPDVIRKILGEEPEGHARLMCGFDYAVPLGSAVEFGFECDAKFSWLKVLGDSAGTR